MPKRSTLSRATKTTFESIHERDIAGKLTMFDRILFRGHLNTFDRPGAFREFLWRIGVPIAKFSHFAKKASEAVKSRAEEIAQRFNRPYQYLESSHTRASGKTKEDLAREIAGRDGITEGLICVFAAVEPCSSYGFRKQPNGRQELRRLRRKCLHFYFYFFDPEFGFMHVRVQSWFPMMIQVYINGREWLCRQLDKQGIQYKRYKNAIVEVEDLARVNRICKRFIKRKWPRFLDRYANMVNPWLKTVRREEFRSYYWCTEQSEVATDIMFKSRASLRRLMPDLLEHASLVMSARDILQFMGGKRFCSEITTDHKSLPQGRRVKHRLKRNTIKMYDKHNVLRIETTINSAKEFKVLRLQKGSGRKRSRRWMYMRKGVADFWRLAKIGDMANERYLEALAHAKPKKAAIEELDRLCRSRTTRAKRISKFNPVSHADAELFAAALAGEHAINGFRNSDIRSYLYPRKASSKIEDRRRSARVTRLIAKLRGHKLIAKVRRSNLYRLTKIGVRMLSATLHFRNKEFPDEFLALA